MFNLIKKAISFRRARLYQLRGAMLAIPLTLAISMPASGYGQNKHHGHHASHQKMVPLPKIFHKGKAINYSSYRGALQVNSSVEEIQQDLRLLDTAKFNLIRLFSSGDNSRNILSVAKNEHPGMKFQIGMPVEPAPIGATCESHNLPYLINTVALANDFPETAVAISVGNETFWGVPDPLNPNAPQGNLPVDCLANLIKQVREGVNHPIPITTTQFTTFFSGSLFDNERGIKVDPLPVLSEIDFIEVNIYPWFDTLPSVEYFTDLGYDWRQLEKPEGKQRGKALMREAVRTIKSKLKDLARVTYRDENNRKVKIGKKFPIVISETGWKAYRTSTQNKAPDPYPSIESLTFPITDPALIDNLVQVEAFGASEINQKLYLDLLNKKFRPGKHKLPVNIFYFVAFDEKWKENDDGWGLWDAVRSPREALCDTPAGNPCKDPKFETIGYYPKEIVNLNPETTLISDQIYRGRVVFSEFDFNNFGLFDYPVGLLPAIFTTSPTGEAELVMKPNTTIDTASQNDNFWIVDGMPAKRIFQQIYVDRLQEGLLGNVVTFSGFVKRNTLGVEPRTGIPYEAFAIIQVVAEAYNNSDGSFAYRFDFFAPGSFVPLVDGQPFNISWDTAGFKTDLDNDMANLNVTIKVRFRMILQLDGTLNAEGVDMGEVVIAVPAKD